MLTIAQRKCSFAEIGKTIGLSKTAVNEIYRKAPVSAGIRRPNRYLWLTRKKVMVLHGLFLIYAVLILKMQYDRWSDYAVAHENIRRVLSCVPAEVVADFLFVTEQTFKAWRCGKSVPDCSRLIALSVIAGRGLSDFLGVNIPKASPKSIPQLLEAELLDSQGIPSENEGWIYESEQELFQKLAYDFSREENSHIETLGKFILYLPLFDDGNLRDFRNIYKTAKRVLISSHWYAYGKR